MDRRTFIRGLLVSAAGTEAIVRLASAEETQQLTVRQPVMVGQPKFELPHGAWMKNMPVYIEGKHGFTPIGFLTSLNVHTSINEMHSWDGTGVIVPGMKRGEFTIRGEQEY